jgi:hypothetical protein
MINLWPISLEGEGKRPKLIKLETRKGIWQQKQMKSRGSWGNTLKTYIQTNWDRRLNSGPCTCYASTLSLESLP